MAIIADVKHFYWLKLKEDFFRLKEIKKLRKVAGGDTFTIIYLKMLLRSLKDGGKLYYEGYEANFASELALDIDEDEENVKMTVAFLMANGILVENQSDEFEILTAGDMTGSETDSAKRMRRLRSKESLVEGTKASLCDGQASHCDTDVTSSDADVTKCDTEIEIDKRDRDIDRNKAHTRFIPPTQDDVETYMREYARKKGYYIDAADAAEDYCQFYGSKGWKVGSVSMKDWKMAACRWVKNSVSRRKEIPTYTGSPNYDPSKPLY